MKQRSPLSVWKEWCNIPDKERNSGLAKKFAKAAGMRSMGEVRLAAWLTENGLDYEYESEKWEYQHELQHYTPDFKVGDVYLEYKGKMTDETRKKLLSIKRCNPDKDLRIVFERPQNKLRKGAKMLYSQWATSTLEIPWADQLPPIQWFS